MLSIAAFFIRDIVYTMHLALPRQTKEDVSEPLGGEAISQSEFRPHELKLQGYNRWGQ